MFDSEDDNDLFLSDIGSLSQIYDKKQFRGKRSSADLKKFGVGQSKVNVFVNDKNGKPSVHTTNNANKQVEQNASPDLVSEDPSKRMNLYDGDEDIKIPNVKMITKEAYSDDRIYDDFELNTKPTESKPVDSLTKTKSDAPWLNREKVPENDTNRLLEYERSFKNDQFIDDGYSQKRQKQFPREIETQAKTARSLQRKQMKFDANYSKWAYDDEYDNEDKSDDKGTTAYDPEQAFSETGASRLFARERFKNPESPFTEVLDENYPNANDLRPYKVGKIRVGNKLEEKLKASLKEPKTPRNTKSEDEDVIILDDTLPTNVRIRNEVNKKIKISFNPDHNKPKSKMQDSLFNNNSPDIIVDSGSEPNQLVRKIPVLETSNISTVNPSASNIRPVTPGPPIIGSNASLPHFSNPPYSMMDRNYYNSFGANVNEMLANRNFVSEPPSSEFYPTSTSSSSFAPTHSWIPINPTPSTTANVEKVPNAKEPSKADKVTSEDAVKEEIRQQNMKLMGQRDQYLSKYNSLNEELNKLKKQKKTLIEKKSPQADEFLKENQKLQNEIANKIKAVKNVIDMLSKIIKDEGMKGSSDSPDEGVKKNSTEADDSSKEQQKKKRKHSRSRSKSRHRSRSRSKSRRSRSRSRHRSRSRSRSRYRRRSRSRDKYYRRRRSPSRDKKKKRDKEEKTSNSTSSVATPAPAPAPVVEPTPVTTVPEPTHVVEKPKEVKLSDRFKSSFEEIYNRPIEPPKVAETKKFSRSGSRFADKPSVEVTATLAVPAVTLEPAKPIQKPVVSKGWARGSSDTINYVYYDPEIHWCRVCNVFPKTAKEYLLHLHTPEHKHVIATNNLTDYPWHKNQIDTKKTTTPGAPTERIPIRGLPFFVSATAWYCKLCDEWMGDLHCASAHLKSDQHENHYLTFLESNPKWEEHWTDSRAKAHQAVNAIKVPETVTPAYSMETYIKPTPIPPPPPPLQLRPGGTESKKRSSSTSSSSSSFDSSSSSSSSSPRESHKKKKKTKRSKDRKRSVEKETKFKMVVTDAKRARELAKKVPAAAAVPQPEPAVAPTVSFNFEEEDKFVQEWMNTVRSKSKEKDFQELKNKLNKKKEAPLPAPPPATDNSKVVIDSGAKKPTPSRRTPERDRSRRDDDYRGGSDRSRVGREDRGRRSPRDDSRYKRSNGSDSRSTDKYRSGSDRGNRDDKFGSSEASKRSQIKKTVIDRRFPFIGKMPSKNAIKKSGELADPKAKPENKNIKVVPPVPNQPAKPIDSAKPKDPHVPVDPLTQSIQKQLAEYDRPNDVDVAVVDMDINEDEDEVGPVSIVVDDNISRKKDFDETLKLLYPEDKPKPGLGGLPPNLSQDYLVSLIRSTIKEKQLTLNDGNENSQILEIASSMKEILFNNTNIADIPIPIDERPVHISSEEQLYNVPLPDQPGVPGVEEEPEPAPPGTVDESAAIKKKKNPISQKKRRHMRKIREKLEEQEKLLQQKIEERTGQTEASADVSPSASAPGSTSATPDETQTEAESSSPTPGPINVMDSDLMMLGIDEDDSAALLF